MRHEAGRRSAWITAAGLIVGLALVPAIGSAQDLTLHATTTTRGTDTPTITYISAIGTRTGVGQGTEVILRLDQKKSYLLNTKQKTYSEATFDELQKTAATATAAMENVPPEVAAQMKKMMGGAGDVAVTPAGPGENIAGYATEKYHVTMGSAMEIDMWVAPALAVPVVYYDALKAAMPANPMFDFKKMYDEFKKIKGMQLKSVTSMKMMGQSMTTTMVVTSVDKGAIPPSTFDVPAGFKLVPMK